MEDEKHSRLNWDDMAEYMHELIDQFYAHDPEERAAAHQRVAQHIEQMKLRDRPH